MASNVSVHVVRGNRNKAKISGKQLFKWSDSHREIQTLGMKSCAATLNVVKCVQLQTVRFEFEDPTTQPSVLHCNAA